MVIENSYHIFSRKNLFIVYAIFHEFQDFHLKLIFFSNLRLYTILERLWLFSMYFVCSCHCMIFVKFNSLNWILMIFRLLAILLVISEFFFTLFSIVLYSLLYLLDDYGFILISYKTSKKNFYAWKSEKSVIYKESSNTKENKTKIISLEIITQGRSSKSRLKISYNLWLLLMIPNIIKMNVTCII